MASAEIETLIDQAKAAAAAEIPAARAYLVAILNKAETGVTAAAPEVSQDAMAIALDFVPPTWRPLLTSVLLPHAETAVENVAHQAIGVIRVAVGSALTRIDSLVGLPPAPAAPAPAS